MLVLMTAYALIGVYTLFRAIKKTKSKDDNKAIVLPLLYLCAIGCLMQLVLLHTGEKLSPVVISLYLICVYWLLYFTARFMEDFTAVYSGKRVVKLAFAMLGVVDSTLMLLNAFVPGTVFKVMAYALKRSAYTEKLNLFVMTERTPFYWYHIVVTSLLIAIIVLALGHKTLVSINSFYRIKYLFVFVPIIIAVAANIWCIAAAVPVDYSAMIYCLVVCLGEYVIQKYTPRKLHEQTSLVSIQQMSDGAFIFDADKHCVFSNNSGQKMFPGDYAKRLAEKTFSIADNPMYKLKDNFIRMDRMIIEVQGELKELPFSMQFRKLKHKDEVIGYYLIIHDRTAEIEDFKQEHYKITHDELTGLYNKDYFTAKAQQLLKANPDVTYYFVLSDIDNFKMFNELYGTELGDKVLVAEAELLRSLASSESVFGRLNGDEFAVVVREERFSDDLFVECIRNIREQFSDILFKICINAGVYKIENPDEPIMSMYNKAQIAINSIGDEYSTVLAHYSQEMFDDAVYKRWLLDEMDNAIANDEFKMFLQPQVEGKSGRWIGAEALVRWIHHDRGMISPGEFIPLFEKMGVVGKIDEIIWEKAVQKLREWQDTGREELYISVNISGADFYHMNIYDKLTSLIEKYQISPKNLKLEVTESFVVEDAYNRSVMLAKLRDYGFEVEIDDFGSGYSALNSLKDIPCDVIKVDMGFLSKTVNSEQSNIILEMVIELIKRLDKAVVCEGVETEEQLALLRNFGCDVFQGYYFSKPIPLQDFENKVFA